MALILSFVWFLGPQLVDLLGEGLEGVVLLESVAFMEEECP